MTEFDVFISYNWDIQDKVKQLYKLISQDYGFKTSMNINQMKPSQSFFTEIVSSKVIVACITKAYSQSDNCRREIMLAVHQKKPIIALMFEKVSIADLGEVGFIILPLLRINLFDYTNGSFENIQWSEINDKILKSLQECQNKAAPGQKTEKPFSNIHMLLNFKSESNKILYFKYLENDLVACVEQHLEDCQKKLLIVRKFDGSIQQIIDFLPTIMYFYPKQKLLLSASTDPEVFIWKTNNNYQKNSFKTDAPILAFDILDNEFLVTMSEKDVSLWKYETNTFVLQKKFDCPVEDELFACIKALPENKLACGLTNSIVCILDVDLKQVISFKAHEKGLRCLRYTLIKDLLISLSVEDKRVKLWNYKKGECVSEIVLDVDSVIRDYLVIIAYRYIGVVCGDICGNRLMIYDSFDMEPVKEIKRFNDFEFHSDYFKSCEFVENYSYCVFFNIYGFSVIKFE